MARSEVRETPGQKRSITAPDLQDTITTATARGIVFDDPRTVLAAGAPFPFDPDLFRRRCVIEGLDKAALKLGDAEPISVRDDRAAEAEPWRAPVEHA